MNVNIRLIAIISVRESGADLFVYKQSGAILYCVTRYDWVEPEPDQVKEEEE